MEVDHALGLGDDRAGVAHQAHADRQLAVGGGGGLEGQLSTVAQARGGGDGVLHLDALMGQQTGEGEQLLDVAEQPQGQVHQVHTLVHQGAAAIELPGAAPGPGVVVLLGAPQRHLDGRGGQAAELPLGDERLEELVLGGEATLAGDRQDLARALLRVADPVGGLDRDLDRLLQEHVLAGVERLDRHIGVQPGGHRDDHHVDVLARQQLLDAGGGLYAVLLGHGSSGVGIRVGQRDQGRRGRVGQQTRHVLTTDDADADHAEAQAARSAGVIHQEILSRAEEMADSTATGASS